MRNGADRPLWEMILSQVTFVFNGLVQGCKRNSPPTCTVVGGLVE